MIDAFQIIGGLIVLVIGGDTLVKGASGLALRFNIPPMLVGMTVVALGTSSPELFVTLQAALEGKPDISIGNVVGSNIANVALILGITTIIFPIAVNKSALRIDWVAVMLASFIFVFAGIDGLISRTEGIIFVLLLAGFILFSFLRAKKSQLPPEIDAAGAKSKKLWMLILFVVIGIVGLLFGSEWFLMGAEATAKRLGVSDRIIAVSLVSFGTSVPELAASVIAAFKKEQDISLGNILGSNLFNILAILGITSIVYPIGVAPEIMQGDIYWMLGTSFLILPLAIRKFTIGRMGGFILLSSYLAFIFWVLA